MRREFAGSRWAQGALPEGQSHLQLCEVYLALSTSPLVLYPGLSLIWGLFPFITGSCGCRINNHIIFVGKMQQNWQVLMNFISVGQFCRKGSISAWNREEVGLGCPLYIVKTKFHFLLPQSPALPCPGFSGFPKFSTMSALFVVHLVLCQRGLEPRGCFVLFHGVCK